MNKSTFRETVLPLLLPALLVGAIYFLAPQMGNWAQSINPSKRLDRLQTEAKRAAAPPGDEAIFLAQAQAGELRGTLDQARREKEQLEKRWQELVVRTTSPNWRTETTAHVEKLLGYHNLALLEQSLVEGDKGQLPPSLQAAFERLAGKAPEQKPQLVRFRVVGRYADLVNALEEMSRKNGGWGAVPVGLGMDETDLKTDDRTWTLLIWI